MTTTVSAPGRLVTTEEFENIIVRQTANAPSCESRTRPTSNLGHRITTRSEGSTANLVERWMCTSYLELTSSKLLIPIYETMEHANRCFTRHGYKIVYDTTPASRPRSRDSEDICRGADPGNARGLHFFADIRATIIRVLTIPVSLIGTFIFFPVLGSSVKHALDVRSVLAIAS